MLDILKKIYIVIQPYLLHITVALIIVVVGGSLWLYFKLHYLDDMCKVMVIKHNAFIDKYSKDMQVLIDRLQYIQTTQNAQSGSQMVNNTHEIRKVSINEDDVSTSDTIYSDDKKVDNDDYEQVGIPETLTPQVQVVDNSVILIRHVVHDESEPIVNQDTPIIEELDGVETNQTTQDESNEILEPNSTSFDDLIDVPVADPVDDPVDDPVE